MRLLLTILLLFSLHVSTAAQEQPTPALPEDDVQVELGRSAEEYYNLGNWYAEREQHVKAIAYYKAALGEQADFSAALINLGRSLRAVDRHSEAIAAYRKAIEIGTDITFVHLNLGNALMDAGQARQATLSFRIYIELEPYDPAGYARLAYALYILKDYREAAETFDKLVILDEERLAFNAYQAARCYALSNDFDMAAERARTALTADPNIRYAITDEEDFQNFRRSRQFRELLTEFSELSGVTQ